MTASLPYESGLRMFRGLVLYQGRRLSDPGLFTLLKGGMSGRLLVFRRKTADWYADAFRDTVSDDDRGQW